MVAPRGSGTGRTSKGRRRIEIAFIEDPARRMVTFSKRKSGFLKKASELSLLCGASVAAIVFSQGGRPFEFGNPSVGHVLRRFAPFPACEKDGLGVGFPGDAIDDSHHREAVEATSRRLEETRKRVAGEKARMDAVGEKVLRAAAGRFWWEADVEALGVEELPEFSRALHRLRDDVRRRADKLPAAGPCLAADDAAAVEPSAAAPCCSQSLQPTTAPRSIWN